MYVRELRARYRLRRVGGLILPTDGVTTPADAARIFTQLFRDEVVEVAGQLCLATRHQLLAYHELGRGTVDSTIIHPRDIFKAALLSNATAVVIGHNHPSGDVMPSTNDIALTRRILSASESIGIDLLDHIIVSGDGKYFSFKEAGQL